MTKNKKHPALFITFEGGEGSGKSTQTRLLAEHLEQQGHDVVLTREPGGTPETETLRGLLVDPEGGDWSPMAETLLMFAARSMHVDRVIKPALEAGKIVICDRFTDSTRAYQGAGHGVPVETIEAINSAVLGDFGPDLTFILDLPVETGLARAKARITADGSSEDRNERLDVSFHERLRQAYLDIASKEPKRCVVVDAEQSVEEIAEAIQNKIEGVIPAKAGIE